MSGSPHRTPAFVWALRIPIIVGLIALTALSGSSFTALAFALAWCPNGLFLSMFERDALHLPRALVPVRRIEPVIYRWLGIGLVKRIVATRMWLLINGQEPPPAPKDRQELLDRTDLFTRGAEVCHGATFLLALAVTLYLLAAQRYTDAAWLPAFNVLLDGYPVMLQRANRYRVQQVRAATR